MNAVCKISLCFQIDTFILSPVKPPKVCVRLSLGLVVLLFWCKDNMSHRLRQKFSDGLQSTWDLDLWHHVSIATKYWEQTACRWVCTSPCAFKCVTFTAHFMCDSFVCFRTCSLQHIKSTMNVGCLLFIPALCISVPKPQLGFFFYFSWKLSKKLAHDMKKKFNHQMTGLGRENNLQLFCKQLTFCCRKLCQKNGHSLLISCLKILCTADNGHFLICKLRLVPD